MGSANSKSVTHLVVMGVAGSGKTTASRSLRELTGWPIAEADDFHPAANIEKMSAGIPLTDEDRWPWLDSLRTWMTERANEGSSTIVTCSALKRSYRDLLAEAPGRVVFVHLIAEQALLDERMKQREGHFMPPALLPSQFAALEQLEADEDGFAVESRETPELTLRAVEEALAKRGVSLEI
ncbi:gluconokinase [Actinomyces mediterranea]|uniref:gluconokinase n=1 Tax=Actinomyces mediterranea TaxID=1871028 RepID=UPI000970B47E|nr:gluconokinase [Actinomyces mediterranea]